MLLELLFGELGPEPGALLHAESEPHKLNTNLKQTDSVEDKRVGTRRDCGSPTCHIKGAFLGGGDGAVSATQQRTAPPLAHLLLQPGAKLQVGFRGWTHIRRTLNTSSLIIYSLANKGNKYLLSFLNWYNKYNQLLASHNATALGELGNFPGLKFQKLEALDLDPAQNYLFGEQMQFIYHLDITLVYKWLDVCEVIPIYKIWQ